MTDIKTPERIAGEVIAPVNANPGHYSLNSLLVDAIEADRAQPRDELTVTLPSSQEIRVWIGTSDADGSALVQIDTGGDVHGNVRVFINDSDDPILDENPETGQYEDMSEGGEQ